MRLWQLLALPRLIDLALPGVDPAGTAPGAPGASRLGSPVSGVAVSGSAPSGSGEPFRVLYVCAGNLCRSVLAERLARRALRVRPGGYAGRFQVTSAGIRAVTGQPAHPYTLATLARSGADTDGFVARRLTPALVRDSDLVLTATVRHRDHVVSLLPAASRRTFTILEFARIAASVPAGAARDTSALATGTPAGPAQPTDVTGYARRIVDTVATLRGQVAYVAPAADDIADPPRRPAAFRACARDVGLAVEATIAALCPAEPIGRAGGARAPHRAHSVAAAG